MSSPFIMYDGASVSKTSALGKELMKWERPSDYRPENHPYPKMLYKAHTRPDGKRSVGEVNDRLFAERGPEGQLLVVAGAAEQWTRRCQMTVKDDYEKQRAYEGGWRDTPQAALDFLEEREKAIDRATAERHAADARMSPQAQAEAAAVDLSTLRQVPVIPEKPARRKPGPKPKAQPATE